MLHNLLLSDYKHKPCFYHRLFIVNQMFSLGPDIIIILLVSTDFVKINRLKQT